MVKMSQLNKNIGKVFVVCEALVCDTERGCYTDKQEAINYANKEKLSSKNSIEIHVYEWDKDIEEYVFIDELDF